MGRTAGGRVAGAAKASEITGEVTDDLLGRIFSASVLSKVSFGPSSSRERSPLTAC